MHHSPQTTSGRWSQRAVPGNLEIGARSNPNYSAEFASFCVGCLDSDERVAAVRAAAFLRRKYDKRRLRLPRTRCCCPMESLSIET
jgi:hypothetical protein